MIEYDKFVFDEIRRIGRAWRHKNPDSFPSELSDDQIEHIFEKIGDMSYRRLEDGKSVKTILEEIGVSPADYGEIDPIPTPGDLTKYPRYGLSIAALLVNTKHDIIETVKRFVDAGANSTRINLLSALWPGVDCLPFNHFYDGFWDLFDWNNQYFERLAEIKERINSNGITIQWTNYELYSWSRRKPGNQQINTPWRNNINGIYWSPEDITLTEVLPDEWSIEWFKKVCPLLDLHINPFEIGNEFPEKSLHERVRIEVLKIVPDAKLQVNRNDNKPGQYTNMKIGLMYDLYAFHGNGLKELKDLDKVYDEPVYKTFQQFIDNCPHDKERVIFSSDGARISDDPFNTYDWIKLGVFFDYMIELGYNIEHQSRAKMTPAPNHHMIEVDWFKERVKNRL